MPFMGKDWRSSGDQWIRTEHGWERSKALECILDNLSIGLKRERVMHNKSKKKQQRHQKSSQSESLNENDDDDDENENVLNTTNNTTTPSECSSSIGNDSSIGGSISASTNSNEEKSVEEDYSDDDDEEEDDDDYFGDSDQSSDDDEDVQKKQENEENNKNSKSESRTTKRNRTNSHTLSRLSFTNGSVERYNYKTRQPHIIFHDFETMGNREKKNVPRSSISDVLAALDMPGAVRDIKRFNYVCRLVQIVINEKLHHLSGNAQRTLFMIVKQMIIQVIKTQENLNVMRKLLIDLKKKIADCYFYYFYYIGSQKLSEKYLSRIAKWQEMLDNPNHKRAKRLIKSHHHHHVKRLTNTNKNNMSLANNNNNTINDNNKSGAAFESIPFDCKLEIMRRLNTGLDLINLAKCSKNLNVIITQELAIWKNLCQFHFHQTNINSMLISKKPKSKPNATFPTTASGTSEISLQMQITTITENENKNSESNHNYDYDNDDWKRIYFNLKKRYGHREVYVDMIHKCAHCKCLFWKEIGHPCSIHLLNASQFSSARKTSATNDDNQEFVKTEPITPKNLINLLIN